MTPAIRHATADDIQQLLPIGRRFADYVPHGDSLRPSDDDILSGIESVWNAGGTIIVAELNGRIIGTLVAVLSPVWYCAAKQYATELGWWIEPEHRKGMTALRLIREYERWAEECGADVATMCFMYDTQEERIDRLYTALNYRQVETTFKKTL